jgi:hypothetical protein
VPMSGSLFHIKPVRSAAGLQATVQLFNAYASSLTVDLANQDFATEIATLPGKCAVPTAVRLSVRLRPVESDGCREMKRLYVLPKARVLGLSAGRCHLAGDGTDRIPRNAAGHAVDDDRGDLFLQKGRVRPDITTKHRLSGPTV